MSSSCTALFERAIGHMLARVDETAEAVGDEFPLSAEPSTGAWLTAPDGRWAGGFWAGLLWLGLLYTGDPRYRRLAESAMNRLEVRLRLDNVLNGLVFYYGAALGAILDNNQAAADLASRGAKALADHYGRGAGFIPLGRDSGSLTTGSDAETNVDGLPGMSLLTWAAEATNNADLAAVGLQHVHRHIELCMRQDGSLYQAAIVNPQTGTILKQFSPRGHSETSTWARAQSWGLLSVFELFDGAMFTDSDGRWTSFS